MEHAWTEFALGSTENLNGDLFMEPGWTCRHCGLKVVFPAMMANSNATYAKADHIVADPEIGEDLRTAEILAASYGAGTCEAQIVRFVMES